MRKWKHILAISLVILCCSSTVLAEEIPLRNYFETNGYTVNWNTDQSIALQKDDLSVICKVNSDKIKANTMEYTLSDRIVSKQGTTYMEDKDTTLIANVVLYNRAVIDAVLAEQDEILPLISLKKDEKVLVCTWNKYPDSYKTGTQSTAKYGEIWTFTMDEIKGAAHKINGAEDKELRFEQLLGLPIQKGYTHFSVLEVAYKDLLRPAYNNNPSDGIMTLDFTSSTDRSFENWFLSNEAYSYVGHKFPWTRLGYTYDWADNGSEYGLSEFIIKKDAPFHVIKTYTNEEFFNYLQSIEK